MVVGSKEVVLLCHFLVRVYVEPGSVEVNVILKEERVKVHVVFLPQQLPVFDQIIDQPNHIFGSGRLNCIRVILGLA